MILCPFSHVHNQHMASPSLPRQSERRVTFASEPVVLQEFPLFLAFDSKGFTWVCRHCQRIPYEWASLQPPPNQLVDMHLISCDGLNTGEEKTSSIPKQSSGDITTDTTASPFSPNSMEIRNAARDLLLIRSSKDTRLKPLVVSFDDDDDGDHDIKVKQVKNVRKKSQDLIHGETWTCQCGNQNAVEKMRCGKCLHWKGGRRNVTWSTSQGKRASGKSLKILSCNSR